MIKGMVLLLAVTSEICVAAAARASGVAAARLRLIGSISALACANDCSCASVASGFVARFTSAIAAASCARASPSTTMKRHGLNLP